MSHANYVTIERFAELTGYTADAVRSKIARGDWLQDREYVKAPDGRILMYVPGYELWAAGKAVRAFGKGLARPSKSTSAIAVSGAANA